MNFSPERADRPIRFGSPGGRIDDIEVLRAVAIILVIVHHLKYNLFHWKSQPLWFFSDWFGSGRGVDLFFVISGFVIARGLLPQLQAAAGTRQFLRATMGFWIRRFWRIVPAAWTCIAVSLTLVFWFNDSGALGTIKGNLIAAAGAVFNVANYTFRHLFGHAELSNILFVHWSLSLEMQFYLLFPLIVLLATRRFLVPFLILLAAVQLVLTTSGTSVFRSEALSIGVLLAIWSTHPSYRRYEPAVLKHAPLGLVTLVLIYAALVVLGGHSTAFPGPRRTSLAAPVCMLAVFIASYDLNVLVASQVPRKVMLWIGSRSYSLYLWHILAFAVTREIYFRFGNWPLYGMSDAAIVVYTEVGIGLCLLLAEASYRLIEVPLRRRGRRIARRWQTGEIATAAAESGRAVHPG